MALDRLKVLWKTLACREFWRLGVRGWIGLAKAAGSTRPASAPSGTIIYANCPPVGSLGFRRYLNGLKALASGRTVPLVAHVSVTDRCGYRCARCSNLRRSVGDPSEGMLRGLLDGLKRAGTASIAFTGGEPMLRDDLEALIAACLPEMPPLVFTTGEHVDAGRARRLRSAGLMGAYVSLDHYLPGEHDAIRGRPGAFETALRAIAAFRDAGVYTAAQAVVTSALMPDEVMHRFLSFCVELGVHDVVLLEPVPVCGDGSCETLDASAREALAALHRRAVRDRSLPKVTAMSFLEGAGFFGCQAGSTFLYVSASGDVFPCDFAPVSFGNVYELGVDAIVAQLGAVFGAPSQRCLALDVRGHSGPLPVACGAWKRKRSGAVPDLMRWFLPAGVRR